MPQSQAAALPRHEEEEETDKTKQALIIQTHINSFYESFSGLSWLRLTQYLNNKFHVHFVEYIWAATWENVPSLMYAQRRLKHTFWNVRLTKTQTYLLKCTPNKDWNLPSEMYAQRRLKRTFWNANLTKTQTYLLKCTPNEDSNLPSEMYAWRRLKLTFWNVRLTKIYTYLLKCTPNEDSNLPSEMYAQQRLKLTFWNVRLTKTQTYLLTGMYA